MKIWCTKWALTKGILEFEVKECGGEFPGMVEVIPTQEQKANGWTFHSYLHGEGKDWHRTEAAAVEKAIHMADARCISLGKARRKAEKQAQELRDRHFALIKES